VTVAEFTEDLISSLEMVLSARMDTLELDVCVTVNRKNNDVSNQQDATNSVY
jgi:hypothetical protein